MGCHFDCALTLWFSLFGACPLGADLLYSETRPGCVLTTMRFWAIQDQATTSPKHVSSYLLSLRVHLVQIKSEDYRRCFPFKIDNLTGTIRLLPIEYKPWSLHNIYTFLNLCLYTYTLPMFVNVIPCPYYLPERQLIIGKSNPEGITKAPSGKASKSCVRPHLQSLYGSRLFGPTQPTNGQRWYHSPAHSLK